ncbi:ABC transporter permease [Chryseotalea sanaruensis]|uniref:ABC transporter permease n=1 Tax=Chryseotalea sanaruensis TaxID=2482724 RepID=A0A401U8Z6_9BACT|nr:ABC transporter permease [Chryseotalea sanaruensis]GCC51347.1 ABC transporter permease [Chryseotalea sanaruensis]
MLKNYLLITLRTLFRNKAFSSINIVGLAFGMSCSLIILLWVNDEMSVDAFHEHNDRLYRVLEKQSYTNGSVFVFSSTPGPMAPVIKEKFPEIELASRVTWPENRLFVVKEKSFYQEGRFVDADFLQMFSFKLSQGDTATALKSMYSIVVSKGMAERFFGDENPIGKVLVMDNEDSFTVSAVLDDIPSTSSIKFDYLISFDYYYKKNENWLGQWGNNNIRTNLLLRKDANVAALAGKMTQELNAQVEGSNVTFMLQIFQDAYLYGKFENGVLTGGRIEYVRIFLIVAILVLVIASINFMNLTTAQSAKRAKEVGLRKTVGAVRGQLTAQFLGESMLMVAFSSMLAIAISFLMLPIFNQIADKQLQLSLVDIPSLSIFIAIILFTGLLSGSYPAFYVSSFQPSKVLKGQMKSGTGAAQFRKVLVVLQFSLSIILIISTIVVYKQLNFVQQKDIGFNRGNVMYMRFQGDVAKHKEAIYQQLKDNAAIEHVSFSSANPIDFGNSTSNLVWEGKAPDEQILFSNFSADEDFVTTMQMDIVEGRGFSKEFPTDTSNFIINEAAKKAMGFNVAAEQSLTLWGERKGKIIGVVKDFHFQSIHSKVEPLFIMFEPDWFSIVFIRHKSGEAQAAISALESINKQYASAYPFNYNVMDADWDNLYKSEERTGRLFNYFAILSIIISCLGLFGLSAYAAEQRTKELGVRRVLGATSPVLVGLMAKDFARLVIIAALIGCPVGWRLMHTWLQSYAYHIDVDLLTVFLAAFASLVVALGTVGYHSLKVALANPANSLRYE